MNRPRGVLDSALERLSTDACCDAPADCATEPSGTYCRCPQRLTQEADQVRWGPAYRSCAHGGRVFAREDGSDLTPEQVTKTFARLVKAAGVRPQRLHDLRHLSASFDALAGVPINVTPKRHGHSNPSFTMRVYQNLDAETATQAAEAAAAFFEARTTVVGGRDAPAFRPRDPQHRSQPPFRNTEWGTDLQV